MVTSLGYYNHETPNLYKTTNMQSIMEKSSYGYGGDHFNSHVILENNCLTGNDLHSQQLSQSCSLIGHQSMEKFKEKKRLETVVRKIVYIDHSLAKETREKARARARKRATEKRNMKLGCDGGGSDQYSKLTKLRPNGDQVMDQSTNRLGPWIPFGEDQIQLTDQAEYPSSHFQFKQGIFGEDSSMMSGNWSPSFLLNYQHNLGTFDHEHQFGDFQILGKPWEGINN
ncbi:hypothetical protein L1987_44747 [Smallanthus sonchifolius]|uniref:Uncharacterized protein n=1 Tax=Smallanthus sonchifolius TaxID=185202 RepID=A0ACB9GR22_9ASTR|nr:hypothetical protein L1987_44747 [Smallanthus sonchifolius]